MGGIIFKPNIHELQSIDIATITTTIGVSGFAVTGIASSLFHKWANINSFAISQEGEKILVINNLVTNWLSSITYFFILSAFTFVVAINRSGTYIYLQLFLIYLVCFLLAAINFYYKKKRKIIVDIAEKTIVAKGEKYTFDSSQDFEIDNQSSWFSDNVDSYGLFLNLKNGRRKCIYGYSVYWDIEKLKSEIENRVGSI